MRLPGSLLLGLVALSPPATAQHGAPGGGVAQAAPPQARQYDFLIGQWELDVRPTVSGLAARLHGAPRFTGTWKAWRAFDGWGVEDELRILDGRGDLRSITHALRVYDQNSERWVSTSLDVLAAKFHPGSATWTGKEMVSTVPGKDADGKAIVTRVRLFDITPTAFRYEQARSYDSGRTWEEPALRITAKRTAAAAAR